MSAPPPGPCRRAERAQPLPAPLMRELGLVPYEPTLAGHAAVHRGAHGGDAG